MPSVTSNKEIPQAEKFRVHAKARLAERRQTVTGLAKSLGVSRKTVSLAINNPTMFQPTKRRIAKALKIALT
jgi:plasmid maintenance system antidote protein VapI